MKGFPMIPTLAQLPPLDTRSFPDMVGWLAIIMVLFAVPALMIQQTRARKDREEKRRAEARLRTIEKKLDELIEQNKQNTSV